MAPRVKISMSAAAASSLAICAQVPAATPQVKKQLTSLPFGTLPTSCLCLPGSFDCSCKNGFEKASNGSCVDRDECSASPGPCADRNEVCENLVGSYACSCKRGFKASQSNGKRCEDINECLYPNPNECDNVNGVCNNTEGSYRCGCKAGFRKSTINNACLGEKEGEEEEEEEEVERKMRCEFHG